MPKFLEHSTGNEHHTENFLCVPKGQFPQNRGGQMNALSQQVHALEEREKRVRVYMDLSHCRPGQEVSANMLEEDRDVVPVVKANWNLLTPEEQRRRFGAIFSLK
jgi:hypothetical protein